MDVVSRSRRRTTSVGDPEYVLRRRGSRSASAPISSGVRADRPGGAHVVECKSTILVAVRQSGAGWTLPALPDRRDGRKGNTMKIGILTGGGDCPGLKGGIRASG